MIALYTISEQWNSQLEEKIHSFCMTPNLRLINALQI